MGDDQIRGTSPRRTRAQSPSSGPSASPASRSSSTAPPSDAPRTDAPPSTEPPKVDGWTSLRDAGNRMLEQARETKAALTEALAQAKGALARYELLAKTGTGTLRRSDAIAMAALQTDLDALAPQGLLAHAQQVHGETLLDAVQKGAFTEQHKAQADQASAMKEDMAAKREALRSAAQERRAHAARERGVEDQYTNMVAQTAAWYADHTDVQAKGAALHGAIAALEDGQRDGVGGDALRALEADVAAATSNLLAEHDKVELLRVSLAIVEKGAGRTSEEEFQLRSSLIDSLQAHQERADEHLAQGFALRADGTRLQATARRLFAAFQNDTDNPMFRMLFQAAYEREKPDEARVTNEGLERLSALGVPFLELAKEQTMPLASLNQTVDAFKAALDAAFTRDTALSQALARFLAGEHAEA